MKKLVFQSIPSPTKSETKKENAPNKNPVIYGSYVNLHSY
jgi:hypothetical protein